MSPTLGARASPSVCLSTLAGPSGLDFWRNSAELGRRGSQSQARESSAERLHQLHGGIVLGGGRRQGQVVTAAGETEPGKEARPLDHLRASHPPHSLPKPHLARPPHPPSSLAITGARTPLKCHLHPLPWGCSSRIALSSAPSIHGPLPGSNHLPGGLCPLLHQTGDLKAPLSCSPHPPRENPGLLSHRAPVQKAEKVGGWGVRGWPTRQASTGDGSPLIKPWLLQD